MLRGANSGRRSIGAPASRSAGLPASRPAPSPDDPVDAALLERPGDDQPLDLRGALPDPVDAQLAQEALRRRTRACSRARRRPGRRGRRSARPPPRRTAWRATPWRGRPCGSAPLSASQAHSRVSSRAAEASAAESASGKLTRPGSRRSARRTGPAPSPTRRPASSSRSIAPAQRAPMWIRSSTNHSLVSSSARPIAAEDRRGRHADVASSTNCGWRSAKVWV